VPTASVIHGVKPWLSTLKPNRNKGASVTSCRSSLWNVDLIADNRDPDWRNVQTGFANRAYSIVSLQPSVGSWRLYQFLDLFPQSVGLHRRGDQPVARPLSVHRTAHKHRINLHRNLCLQWDPKPRSQLSSERRQFTTTVIDAVHSYLLTYLLMYGAETFLRSCQLCRHSGNSQRF
jgi:hypothetical protein